MTHEIHASDPTVGRLDIELLNEAEDFRDERAGTRFVVEKVVVGKEYTEFHLRHADNDARRVGMLATSLLDVLVDVLVGRRRRQGRESLRDAQRELYEAIGLSQAQFASTGLDSAALIQAIDRYTDAVVGIVVQAAGVSESAAGEHVAGERNE